MSKNILIVEDDALIAMTLAQDLENAGFIVSGPCRSVAQALQSMKNSTIDAAVLDVNLGAETSAEIAIALKKNDTPFIVLSGYDDAELTGPFAGAPSFEKPYSISDLIARLKAF